MTKQVLLAAPRSFCAGVDRAIEIVERLLESHGAPVYVRHEIVHNDNVVRRLEGLGAVFVDSEDEIPPGEICVLSAHGVAPSVRENCVARGLRVVDAVCPLVSKVHAEARRYADSGHLVALIGHADHVEVIGTKGERPDQIVVVESPEDAAELDTDGKPVAVVSQTTLSLDDVASTVSALEDRFGSLKRPGADDICYATQNRQDAVKEIARLGGTLILVIGSPTSSNANRLVEVARTAGADATLIDGESALEDDLLAGHTVVGLTAGASTPEELVQNVLADLAARGYADVDDVTVAREDVHFRLPQRGRRLVTSVEIPSSVAAALPTLSVFDITNDVSHAIASSERDAGLAYVAASSPLAVVRVTEREAGFFHDFEAMLARLVPHETTERERLIVALLGSRTEQIPFADSRLCLGQWQRVLLFGFNGDACADYTLTLLG